MRALVVNADDLGQSAGINAGIIDAHERGIVTSASLMVRGGAARHAAEYARRHPALSVGLHLDLEEWGRRDGSWRLLYQRVDGADPAAVEGEVRAQLQLFRDLLGADPTHLDSHQHVHLAEPARTVALCIAQEIGVPLRQLSPTVTYLGGFYGQTSDGRPLHDHITSEALRALIHGLSDGVTELGCHPGYADDVETLYRGERRLEVRALCDPAVRRALADAHVTLCSFAQVGAVAGSDQG